MFDRLCPPSTCALTKQVDQWLPTLGEHDIVRATLATIFQTAVHVDGRRRFAVWQLRFEEQVNTALFGAVFQTKQRPSGYQEPLYV